MKSIKKNAEAFRLIHKQDPSFCYIKETHLRKKKRWTLHQRKWLEKSSHLISIKAIKGGREGHFILTEAKL